jgi:hypothetical protein
MNVNINLYRKCRKCGADDRDHPHMVHLLYFLDHDGTEKIFDYYESKESAKDILDLLVSLHGMSYTYNVYKFRYSYEECNGEY